MFVVMVIGVPADSLSCSCEQNGITSRVRFSYSANSRRSPAGAVRRDTSALEKLWDAPARSYSVTDLESSFFISKR